MLTENQVFNAHIYHYICLSKDSITILCDLCHNLNPVIIWYQVQYLFKDEKNKKFQDQVLSTLHQIYAPQFVWSNLGKLN